MKKQHRVVGVTVALLFVGALIVTGLYFYNAVMPERVSESSRKQEVLTQPLPVSLSSNTLFFGDIYWGRYINDWSMASPLKTAYPFSRLGEFGRENYNAWIANLECPTVAGFSQSSAQEDATLSFNCSPDYLPEAAKWFTAVSLANNHTDNRGVDGFEETKQRLKENNIQYFGHYDPDAINDVCEVIGLPVTVGYSNETTKQQKLPIALCGYEGVFKIPSATSIAQITNYAEVMPVIVMPHMGAEYKAAPDGIRMSTYRAMIDAGADMVLGGHPHWIQPAEAYKGKLIVYSMGNFIFDQQANKEVTRSAAIRVVISTIDASSAQLVDWLALGDICVEFKDTCLEQIHAKQLKKLPFEYKFDAIGTNSANKITKPASETEQAEILQRLNWSYVMSQLQAPQGSL